jgi:ABC-type branched-subunit amino acid transport system permease subunit
MTKIATIAAVTLLTELAASWWMWVRAPTDTQRVEYDTFFAYERPRLLVWLIIMVVVTLVWLLFRKMNQARVANRHERR